jgi:hypothetical protein
LKYYGNACATRNAYLIFLRILTLFSVRVVALDSGNPLRRERLPVVLIASLALRMRFLMGQVSL